MDDVFKIFWFCMAMIFTNLFWSVCVYNVAALNFDRDHTNISTTVETHKHVVAS